MTVFLRVEELTTKCIFEYMTVHSENVVFKTHGSVLGNSEIYQLSSTFATIGGMSTTP